MSRRKKGPRKPGAKRVHAPVIKFVVAPTAIHAYGASRARLPNHFLISATTATKPVRARSTFHRIPLDPRAPGIE